MEVRERLDQLGVRLLERRAVDDDAEPFHR